MIRIILALIGVAFCILSSVTAPAHATSVQVSYDNIPSGSLPAGVVHDYRDCTVLVTIPGNSPGLPYSPGQCSPCNS